jgi:hypothetical protein
MRCSRAASLVLVVGLFRGIVNLSEIGGKTRDLHDGEWRYLGVFLLGLMSTWARISSS